MSRSSCSLLWRLVPRMSVRPVPAMAPSTSEVAWDLAAAQ